MSIIRSSVWRSIGIIVLATATPPISRGQERANAELLQALSSTLREASPAEVLAAREQAGQILHRLRFELSEQAIGVVLSPELQLDILQGELQKPAPDPARLQQVRLALRRKLPGKVQQTVNDLRASVVRLTQLLNSSPSELQHARDALDTIQAHLNAPQLKGTADGDAELRQAFATLATAPVSAADMDVLRGRLSLANYASLVKRDYLAEVSKRSFTSPIQFQECREGTAITGQGRVRVDLSLEVPLSQNENLLVVHALGCGQVDASASRNRIAASARAYPTVRGSESVHILPEKVIGDSPLVTANLQTQLTDVQMSGLLGRCRLVLRVLSRIIETRLSASDSTAARQIEQVTRTRIEEEAYDLAHRINGLLHHGVWERILSLDFSPAVRAYNDAEGVRSQTSFVHSDQLGALTSPPPIPAAIYPQLDLVTWVHESAANNVFESLGSIHLREETVRALWQVQFKLTSPAWEQPQPARVPAVITLADRWPMKLRLVRGGMELTLRAAACEVDGQTQKVAPCEAIVRYLIENDAHGVQFHRQEIIFAHGLPESDAAVWNKALSLFFAENMRPMPKFHNTGFSQYLQLGYLNIDNGWLVVGAKRVSEPTASTTASAEGALQ